MTARIPVFVSAPTHLTDQQKATYKSLIDMLDDERFEPRALGRTDYPVESPLREVCALARHCSGGMILGFRQMLADKLQIKPDTVAARVESEVPLPTPWNNLEAGILYSLKMPLIVFREPGIQGGIFDVGASEIYLHDLPAGAIGEAAGPIKSALQNWGAKVRENYRSF